MKTWKNLFIFLFVAFLAAACAGQVSPTPAPPPVTPISSPTATPTSATAEPEGNTTIPTPGTEKATLTVWLPPDFDPQSGSPAGNLLKQRLAEFSEQEGVEVNIRVKALSGQASLLESLSAAKPAAPGALPDLVALSHTNLEAAALKGLIYPYEGLSQEIDNPDWFDYARQLGILQGTNYGLPFTGDALALFYRPARVKDLTASWDSLVHLNIPMALAASDPQAMLTLALYEGAGGANQDAQGRPFLDADILGRVLKYYQQGSEGGLLPGWITGLETEEQAWQAFQEERAHLVIAWISDYLQARPPDVAVQPLPQIGETPHTIARGWSWALASPDETRRAAAARLAEFLVDGQFLASWSEAGGYLPVRPTSLAAWSNQGSQGILSQVILSAKAEPSDDLLLTLGLVLKESVLQVLQNDADPQASADAAAAKLISQ